SERRVGCAAISGFVPGLRCVGGLLLAGLLLADLLLANLFLGGLLLAGQLLGLLLAGLLWLAGQLLGLLLAGLLRLVGLLARGLQSLGDESGETGVGEAGTAGDCCGANGRFALFRGPGPLLERRSGRGRAPVDGSGSA